jgi:cob(I)alamin adenosyltransferase
MALYTGKGDDGTTQTFDANKGRISKSSPLPEALGSCDEVNSFLGFAKVRCSDLGEVAGKDTATVIHWLQEGLFIVQAELAGAEKSVQQTRVEELERIIAEIDNELPPINSFFISGGTELAATFDVARTLARRAERRVVAVDEDGIRNVSETTKAYLNRLSSVLYAMARLANHRADVDERPPTYE